MRTFRKQILKFNEDVARFNIESFNSEVKIVNPFVDRAQDVNRRIDEFYLRYYNDTKKRRLILGSTPARQGSAVTGIPFEDVNTLEGISEKKGASKRSVNFLETVIARYGGRDIFYRDFLMNFVCPLSLIKINSKGQEVNCNYYESKVLKEKLSGMIVESLMKLSAFPVDNSVAYCIGSGENYKFLSKINEEYRFFDKIIPLEHPRFIMQYHSKEKEMYVKKYMEALSE